MNIERIKAFIAKVEADPSCWDQSTWHCDTKHCFAGWGQIDAGKSPDEKTVRRDARQFYDLSPREADYLFDWSRTMEDFNRLATRGNPFDRDGFDPNGFDRDGFDRDGLDKNNKPREA